MFKIATWNVNSLRVRLPHVIQWLQDKQPDVLALQETKLVDKDFPQAEFANIGYQAVYAGQKSYNGVAVLSRVEMHEPCLALPGLDDLQRRILSVTVNQIRILNLYVPNGAIVGSDKYHYKLEWLKHLANYIAEQLQQYPQLVVLGDFNIAPEDCDVHDPIAWQGQVLVSDLERQALQTLIKLGLSDSFRLFEQTVASYSWWDYRAAGFRRNLGLRIDHILLSQALVPLCQACEIDRMPRTWERPSDHAPVMVSLSFP